MNSGLNYSRELAQKVQGINGERQSLSGDRLLNTLLAVCELNLLQGVFEDFSLLLVFHLGNKALHVQHYFTRISLTDGFEDQGQCGFQAGNFGRQCFNVCFSRKIAITHYLYPLRQAVRQRTEF